MGNPATEYTIDTFDNWPIVIPAASHTAAGVMTAADKIKLDLLVPGGGTTLAATYAAGVTPADSTMLLTAAGGGVRIWDNVVPLAVPLFEVASSGGATKYFQVTPLLTLHPTGSAAGTVFTPGIGFVGQPTSGLCFGFGTEIDVVLSGQAARFQTGDTWLNMVMGNVILFDSTGASLQVDSGAGTADVVVQGSAAGGTGALKWGGAGLDVSLARSGTSTLTLDDNAGGSASLYVLGGVVGAATTAAPIAVSIRNTTAATNGAQTQNGPLLEFIAHGWSGAVDQTAKMAFQMRPLAVGAAIQNQLALMGNFNNSGYTECLLFENTNGQGLIRGSTAGTTVVFGASLTLTAGSGVIRSDDIWPNTNAAGLGQPTTPLRWVGHFQARYSMTQAPAFAATMNIDPTLGEVVLITLTANLTNWTISNGLANTAGQLINVVFIQDGTGTRLIGTPPAIIKWLPTTYLGATHAAPVLTITAGARDSTWLYWDGTNWLEVGRNFNN